MKARIGSTNRALMPLLVVAYDEGKTARNVLLETLAELEGLGVIEDSLPGKPQKMEAPQSVAATAKRRVIQELKQAGLTQAEITRQLGMPKTTVRCHWDQRDASSLKEGVATPVPSKMPELRDLPDRT